MSLRFWRGEKRRYDILFDIGSGSVGVGLMESCMEEPLPILHFTHRERMRLLPEFDKVAHLRALREALFSATQTLSEKGLRPFAKNNPGARIHGLRAVVSAPWAKTTTKTISCVDTTQFKATKKMIADLLEKGDVEYVPRASEEKTAFSISNRTTLETRLNGYLVKTIAGQSASEIALTVAHEYISNGVSRTIDEIERNLAPHQNTEERSHAFMLYTTSKALFPNETDMLILDVTGEAVECTLVRDGVLTDTFISARGVYTMIRDLATLMGTIPAEAETHLKHANMQNVKADAQLSHLFETYTEHYAEFFQKIREHHVLPERVFIVSDLSFIGSATTALSQALSQTRNSRLIQLDNALVSHLVQQTPGVGDKDAILGLFAGFFHTEHTRAADSM